MRIRKKRVMFYVLLVVGVGLIVGAVFFPPAATALVSSGVACISAALAFSRNTAQQIPPQPPPGSPVHPDISADEIIVQIPKDDDSLDLSLHIARHPLLSQFAPKPDPNSDINGSNNDSKAAPSEDHHRLNP